MPTSIVHFIIHIPIKDIINLLDYYLISMQEDFRHAKYILINEMHCIGKKLMIQFNAQIHQAFPKIILFLLEGG
jgi:hypothetical protein